MINYPFINLFILTLVSSTFMAISSSHWLVVWLSLEINMISFIPMITSSSWLQESEGALKYLLFQALGSSLLLLNMVFPYTSILVLCGLLTKIGAAPFHFWFPSLMKSLPWFSAGILLTWQKLAPLSVVILSLNLPSALMSLLGAFGALVGGLGGITQSHLRPMLAYSSIGHMGWIVSVSPHSPTAGMMYFFIYLMVSIPIIWSASMENMSILSSSMTKPNPKLLFFITLPCILSLSGLPPMTGFFPKLMIIYSMPSMLIVLLLIMGSLINLSFYLNFFFSYILSTPAFKSSNEGDFSSTSLYLSSLVWLSCCPLPIIFIFSPLFF